MSTTQAKARPILMSGEMVRAILDGRKTQTRRIVKLQKSDRGPLYQPTLKENGLWSDSHCAPFPCPYGAPGDLLWVRETHWINSPFHAEFLGVKYCATDLDPTVNEDYPWDQWIKKPSIFMRREHSRLTLEVVSVRVERLQEISPEDAIAEGIKQERQWWQGATHPVKGLSKVFYCPVQAYQSIWDKINGPGAWERNDWVWVVTFRRLESGE